MLDPFVQAVLLELLYVILWGISMKRSEKLKFIACFKLSICAFPAALDSF